MKKPLCMLLALSILLAFVSCAGPENESSRGESQVSQNTSETISGSDGDTVFVENELIAEIDSMLTGDAPDRTMKAKNLFVNATYTYSTTPLPDHNDTTFTKLNDGIRNDMYDKVTWVAFKGTTPVIQFDLGEGEHHLADVEINMLNQVDYGIHLPSSVTLSVSDDGEHYTKISTLHPPKDVSEGGNYVLRFALPKTVSARYIQLIFVHVGDTFLFMDEITGYEYCEDGTLDPAQQGSTAHAELVWDIYDYTLNREIAVPVDSTDSDYDTYQNLALLSGVTVGALHFEPFLPSYVNSNDAASELPKLIDGVSAANATYADPAFVQFYRGIGRHVIIDLGNEMSIDTVTIEFLNQVSAGVAAPSALMVSISNDGESWITTYGGYTVPYGDPVVQNVLTEAAFKQAFRGRYVRISFCTVPDNAVSSSVFISEIQVWGKKNSTNVPEAQDDPSIVQGRYPDISDFGTNNMYLAAIGGNTAGNPEVNLSVQTALEHIAYLDRDGTIKDVFMDSVLFAPSRQFPFTEDLKANTDAFRKELFAEGFNLDAWDQATGLAQEALPHMADTTVWLDIMCPNVGLSCSDIDGDGKAEDFSTAEGRWAFVKYQVDEYLKAWEQAGLENVKLLGFYWNNEHIFKEYLELEKETIKALADYVHSLGYMFFWCPYYSAYGIWMWEELGFDFACLQPNYMFYVTEPTRLANTADIALIYGMCVELEIEVVTGLGSVNRYREYLRQGFDSGYINSIKMYYVGGIPSALNAAHGHAMDMAQSVYDDTYLFASGKMDDSYNQNATTGLEQFEDLSLEVAHGKRVKFSIGDTEGYSIRIMESTVYGAFELNLSGEGAYRAMKNFRGDDRIVLEISDAAGNKKTVTISITVTEE